jgi:hypothetical protein
VGFFRRGKDRSQSESALAEARAERQRLTAERDELLAALQREQARARDAEDRARAAEARAGAGALDACWPLVIAHLERRWAAGMGARPGHHGVTPGPLPAQLAESLGREVDRLREEVGVDVSFTATGTVEPANPVVFLLTATDLLGAMASRCERVTVELGEQLSVVGEMWTELDDELEAWRDRAVKAGAVIDPVDVGEEHVRVTVHP